MLLQWPSLPLGRVRCGTGIDNKNCKRKEIHNTRHFSNGSYHCFTKQHGASGVFIREDAIEISNVALKGCIQRQYFTGVMTFMVYSFHFKRYLRRSGLRIGGFHCRHVGGQNKRKFVHVVCIKIEVNSHRRKILLLLSTNMAAMTSHANHQ